MASFNLALAMCDALQPKVIWSHLQFDKLIGRNIIVGDFFENLPRLKAAAKNGFDVILGNPPFLSKLTDAAKNTRTPEKKGIPIPDGQIAYCVAEKGMELLHPEGRLCLIEPHGFLYNEKARKFLANFLASNTVDKILDFVSIRDLFEGADPKTIAILVKAGSPSPSHKIIHQTFRRTKGVHDRIGFEMDHYDHHVVDQQTAVKVPWVWKANLLGGGRLLSLGLKAQQSENIRQFCSKYGWDYGEGFIAAKSGDRSPAPWLTGKPCLPTSSLTVDGIMGELTSVEATEFRSAYTETRYTGPIVMIRANEQLPCVFRSNGFLAYRAKIIGISGKAKDSSKLKAFYASLNKNRNILRALLSIFSTQMLVGKSTAFLKRDFDELPSPFSSFFKDLSWWEQIIFEDVLERFSDMVRLGQNSSLMTQSVDNDAFHSYAQTFVRLLGSVYTNLRSGKSGCLNGIAYHAFVFGEASELDWPEDWAEKLEEVVFITDGAAMRTTRVVRFYDQNTLVIIKPDRLRNWIRSTAIRDADETLVDLQQQGF